MKLSATFATSATCGKTTHVSIYSHVVPISTLIIFAVIVITMLFMPLPPPPSSNTPPQVTSHLNTLVNIAINPRKIPFFSGLLPCIFNYPRCTCLARHCPMTQPLSPHTMRSLYVLLNSHVVMIATPTLSPSANTKFTTSSSPTCSALLHPEEDSQDYERTILRLSICSFSRLMVSTIFAILFYLKKFTPK